MQVALYNKSHCALAYGFRLVCHVLSNIYRITPYEVHAYRTLNPFICTARYQYERIYIYYNCIAHIAIRACVFSRLNYFIFLYIGTTRISKTVGILPMLCMRICIRICNTIHRGISNEN